MGQVRYQNQECRQVKNTTGSTLAKGVWVKLNAFPTVEDEIELEDSNTGAIYGVTAYEIEDGKMGDVVIRGRAAVLAGGTIAVGARVMPTTDGKSLTATIGSSVGGLAVTAGVADAYHEVELLGPGGAEMPG
ncbi:MAG: DUF2190 family protein [Deltaproteobacteria bacterium]|nr:DUF2190 family protein [Deltaproteobacteria bacterium]